MKKKGDHVPRAGGDRIGRDGSPTIKEIKRPVLMRSPPARGTTGFYLSGKPFLRTDGFFCFLKGIMDIAADIFASDLFFKSGGGEYFMYFFIYS